MTIWTASTEYACGWTMDDTCAPCKNKFPWGTGTPTADQAAIFQSCVDSAAELLYALSGRQFGLCEYVLRPCRKDPCDPCGANGYIGYPWVPARMGGEWINVSCGKCSSGDGCSCADVCDVYIPGRVHSISQVRLDGRILPTSSYRVDNGNLLVPLIRPVPITGDFEFASAFLDPSARFTTDIPADTVALGVDYGGNTYGPVLAGPSAGIMQLIFRGIDCVTVTYDGPANAQVVTTRPGTETTAGDAWEWPAPGFQFVIGTEVASEPNEDTSSVLGTLLSGAAVTSNPNPPPFSRNITWTDGTSMRFCPSMTERFCWPTCQDMIAEPTEDNTWEVTYLRGLPLPEAGKRSLAKLACELCLACFGDSCCTLPERVTSLVVDGATMPILDPMDFLDKGLTGLRDVDLWLRSVNPKALARGPAILSPDMASYRRTTWRA